MRNNLEKRFWITAHDGLKVVPIEQFQNEFGITYVPTLTFPSNKDRYDAIQNCPWLLRNTLFGKEHRLLGKSLKSRLEAGITAPVEIKYIDETIGYGLFARCELDEGECIGEYAGLVRIGKKDTLNSYCFYYPTKWSQFSTYVIDAKEMGNEMRFVNHSKDPNLKAISVIVDGLLHIVFFAKRSINAGDELILDYGSSYWKNRSEIDR